MSMFKKSKTDAPKPMPVIDVSTRADIKLGQMVREKVTGFEGVITSISHEIDGSVLMGVQPRALDAGKPADPYEFDIERLDPMPEEAILNIAGADQKSNVKLGAIYRDRITGMEGTAVRLIEFLGGCNRITIRPKIDKDGKLIDGIMIPLEQAELLDAGPAVEAEKKKTSTGGPGTSDKRLMSRMSS
ncbi:hypothetical protein vBRpoSV10_102 [Ruegeria phage vB_RpoS-V10]|nr:hypothetical protein vBRpoSV10_102 [Ruegeria phage vB_RpoS-V10]